MAAKSTPNYSISYGWTLGEGAWDGGYNAWTKIVDALMNLSVISDALSAPPASPTAGDRYIVGSSPTGAWAGQAKKIAYFVDAAWVFYTPKRGWRAEVQSASGFQYYNGTVWTAEPSGSGGGIPDAPSDGSTYGRKNAGWVAVTGGGGVTTLDSLTDVIIGTPGNGEVLTYDAPSSQWVNKAVPVTTASAFDRQNISLNWIYQSKLYAGYRRGINLFADGYKAADGIDAGASSGYTLDTSGGKVAPTFTPATDQTATHTSATQSGNIVSASTILNTSSDGWYAFDKVVGQASGGSNWITDFVPTGWLQYKFSSAKIIGSYTIRSGNGFDTRAPSAWTLQGSNTGAFSGEQTTLDARSAQTWAAGGEVKTYAITSPVSYLYYRLNVTANNGASFLQIDEVTYQSVGTLPNLIVVSTPQIIPSSTNARALIEYDATSTPTLNTHLTIELSCDGGTNWTLATLVAAGLGQGGHQVAETNVVTCIAGTSLVARIKVLNKDVSIYGISVSAS